MKREAGTAERQDQQKGRLRRSIISRYAGSAERQDQLVLICFQRYVQYRTVFPKFAFISKLSYRMSV
jgi:hypothetical protein